ncbi:MAG: hypothetical protein IKH45_07390 [Neisseriaceae bacterium]|nr:hypothetical protein [Neisseriaceae bacterium]
MITVNQENLYLLLPYKIGKVCAELSKNNPQNLLKNIVDFYNSPVSDDLHQEDTKLWQESWIYILNMLQQTH